MKHVGNPLQEISQLVTDIKRMQAIFLTELDDILIHDPTSHRKIRKLFLDCTMNLARDFAKNIAGDIEDLVR